MSCIPRKGVRRHGDEPAGVGAIAHEQAENVLVISSSYTFDKSLDILFTKSVLTSALAWAILYM